MKLKNLISKKTSHYSDYIKNNNIKIYNDYTTYNLESYLQIYFLFQSSGLSFNMFFELASFFYEKGCEKNDFPKKTSLFMFKQKMATLEINKLIHLNENVNSNNHKTVNDNNIKYTIDENKYVVNKTVNNNNIKYTIDENKCVDNKIINNNNIKYTIDENKCVDNKIVNNNNIEYKKYISEKIKEKYEIIIIDSTIVMNSQNSKHVNTTGYKNKKGLKIHLLVKMVDNKIIPIFQHVTCASVNDALGSIPLLENLSNYINERHNVDSDFKFILLGDKGYDSDNLYKICDKFNCKLITPKNCRNADNEFIKGIKKQYKKNYDDIRNELMIKQKQINLENNKLKKSIKKLKTKLKREKKIKIDNENTDAFNELINEQMNINKKITQNQSQIVKIKKERKELKNKEKQQVKTIIDKYKQQNKKKCQCNYGSYICNFCNEEKVCVFCDKCISCNKNNHYYKGMLQNDISIYKSRIRIEHNISHLKYGRLKNIKDRQLKTINDSIYNRMTDFIFFRKYNND